ncbi:agmatinase family protein [Petroclostridium sp. X23]|uniref:agmatinase family protein n=1 Tax=Petroclostridium sp. X23 TaxID=3045146 RepID=UPI0024AE2008|nr:agmatinase family protein [Petroclostridium sp. X23]WHH61475.1 agmatinase family protein [Petroclostridium sp. X23]
MSKNGYVYQRTPSFLGVPIVRTKEELKGYDTVVLGMPWEGSVTWGITTGTELATKTIRSASARYSGYMPELNINIFDTLKVCDYSDVDIYPGNLEESFRRFSSRLKNIFEADAFPIIMGGDHGISYPAIKTLCESTTGKVGIIHFDAHYDNKPEYEGDKYARCCPFHNVADIPNLKTTSMVHLGIRGPRNTQEQAEYAKSIGATTFTSFDVHRMGIEAVVDEAYKIASDGTEKIYVTVCSDILDVAFNPGGPPDPNGLTSYELSLALYKLSSYGIHGFDIVEFYPPSDPTNEASHVAAWLIQYVMAGLAQRKNNNITLG